MPRVFVKQQPSTNLVVSPQFYSEVEKDRRCAFTADRLELLKKFLEMSTEEAEEMNNKAAESYKGKNVAVPQDFADYIVERDYVIPKFRKNTRRGLKALRCQSISAAVMIMLRRERDNPTIWMFEHTLPSTESIVFKSQTTGQTATPAMMEKMPAMTRKIVKASSNIRSISKREAIKSKTALFP